MAKLMSKKIKFVNQIQKVNNNNNTCEILLTKSNMHGQKIYEELYHKKENILNDKDQTIIKVKMISKNINVNKFIDKILKINNISILKKEIKKKYKKYLIKKNLTFISKSI